MKILNNYCYSLTLLLTSFLFVSQHVSNAAEVPTPATLDQLTGDPTAFVTSPLGNFRFSDFEVTPVGNPGAPAEVDIRLSLQESGDMVELIFDITANGGVVGPGSYDIALEYTAEAITPPLGFVGHTLSSDGDANNDAFIFINEEILTPGGNGIATVSNTLNVPNRPDLLSDTVSFNPARLLTVQNKDIAVVGGADESSGASLRRVTQTFQVEVIPEPSSLALAIIGLVGLVVAGRASLRTRG